MPPETRIIDQCPHCGTQHVMTEVLGGYMVNENWRILRCMNGRCHKLILERKNTSSGEIIGYFPMGMYELAAADSISQEIRDEFREAGQCLDAGCYKASMVMSRRVLQRCLKDQGCKKHNLSDAIKEAMDSGLLRKAFHDLAKEIKEYGNLGAHPDDEQLENASKENASSILEFLRLIIHEFYEVPAAASSLRQQRS